MSLSVLDPITPAYERTKLVLFQPFDLGKWLRLGFCAFLMLLAEFRGGGGGGGGAPSRSTGGPGNGPDFDPAIAWIRENLAVLVTVAAIVFAVVFVVGLVFLWLSSRGHFMFLDGVVRNRGAVVEPWREFRREGNSLFWFRLCLAMVLLLTFLLLVGLCVLLAWPDIQERRLAASAWTAIALGIGLIVAFALGAAVVKMLLHDFVVPIMYLRRVGAMAAWGELFGSLLPGNLLPFFLYFLMKILIGLVIGFLAISLTCLTCCCTLVPYVGTVIMLPLFVFAQCYPLYFIEQFGPEWRFFLPPKPSMETTI